MKPINDNLKGIGFLALAMFVISLQDIAIKWMSGTYPALEIVIFRSIVALPFTLLFFRGEGNRGLPHTQRHRLEYLRGLYLFLSYTTYIMGLAVLPLADAAAIRLSGPIMITLLSTVFLGEKVDLRRWLALFVGFAGVLLIVRPGSATFNLGSILIVISILFYALSVMVTRQLRTTESSATMAFYSSVVYLTISVVLAPIVMAVGPIPNVHPSIAFLFRAWTMPSVLDGVIMFGLGLVWASWIYLVARAYSLAQASVAAPFEYLALPFNALWGFAIWHEIPAAVTLLGAALTVASGIYIVYHQQKEQSVRLAPNATSPDK